MASLLLLRHGQSTWNEERRWQGWADPPLSPMGRAQAEAVASVLHGHGLEGVVSSDLERARGTAEIVAGALALSVEVEPGLRERDVGEWSGLTVDEIEQHWPGWLGRWRAGQLERQPGGESNDELAARAFDVLHRLAARPEPALLVVTHGGVVRVVERRLGLDGAGTPNLGGRWLHVRGTILSAGEAFDGSVDRAVTAGAGGAE